MSIGPATWLEIFWTFTGLLGLAVCIWAHYDAIGDLRWTEVRPRSESEEDWVRDQIAAEIIARGNVRDEALRVLIFLCFIGIGVLVMAHTPAREGSGVTLRGIIFAILMMAAQIFLVSKAIFNRYDRKRLIALYSIGGKTR